MSMVARPRPNVIQSTTLSTCFSDNSHSSTSESATTSISHSSSNTSWATHTASKLPKGAQPPRLSVDVLQVEQQGQQVELPSTPKRRFRVLRKLHPPSSAPRGHTRSWSLFATSGIHSSEHTTRINLDDEESFAARRQHAPAGPPPSAFNLSRLSRQRGTPTPVSGPTPSFNTENFPVDNFPSSELQNAKVESPIECPPIRRNKPLPDPPVLMSPPASLHREPSYTGASEEELAEFEFGHFTLAPHHHLHTTYPSFSDLGHDHASSDLGHHGYAASEPHFYHMPSRYLVSSSPHFPAHTQSRPKSNLSMSYTPSRKPSWSERLKQSLSTPFLRKTINPSQTNVGLESVPKVVQTCPVPSTSGTDHHAIRVTRSSTPLYTASEPDHGNNTSTSPFSDARPEGGHPSRQASFLRTLSINSLTSNKLRKRPRSESHRHPLEQPLLDESQSSATIPSSKSVPSLNIVDSKTQQAFNAGAPSTPSCSNSALRQRAKKRSNSTPGLYMGPMVRKRPVTPPPPVPSLPAEFGGRDAAAMPFAISDSHHTFEPINAGMSSVMSQGGKKLIKRRRKNLSLTLNISSITTQTSEERDIEVKAVRTDDGPGSVVLPPVRSFSPLQVNLVLGDGQLHTFTDASRSQSMPDFEKSNALVRRADANGFARSLIVTSMESQSPSRISLVPTESDALYIQQVPGHMGVQSKSQASLQANEADPGPQSQLQPQAELVAESLPSQREQQPFSYPPTCFRAADTSSLSSDRPSFLRSQSNRRWTLAVSETPEDKLVEELDRLRSIGWGLGFQGELFRKYPQSSEPGNSGEGNAKTEEGDGEDSGVWAKEEMDEWLVARKALLVCREIVRTENSYRVGLQQLQRGETLKKPPPLLLQYIPALLSASEIFSAHLIEDPSAWGVSMAFVGTEDILESAFVAWSGVVGEFFSSRSRPLPSIGGRRRHSKLEKSAPVSPASATPVRTPTSTSGSTHHQGNWRISMGALSQLLASSSEAGIIRRTRYLAGGMNFGRENTVGSGSGNAKTPTVQDLAIQPTQRVMRYVLLYKDLLSSTPISSPARALVERALEGATRIAQRCNRAQDNAEFLL